MLKFRFHSKFVSKRLSLSHRLRMNVLFERLANVQDFSGNDFFLKSLKSILSMKTNLEMTNFQPATRIFSAYNPE